jgi:hypothetical protein
MCWKTTVTTRCRTCNKWLSVSEFVDKCPNAEGSKCKDGPFKQLAQDPKGECDDCRKIREHQEVQMNKNIYICLRRCGLLEGVGDD